MDRVWLERTAPIRVIVADDHDVVLRGLGVMLDREPGIEVVGEAVTFDALEQIAGRTDADVLVVDLRMPGGTAVDAITRLLPARIVVGALDNRWILGGLLVFVVGGNRRLRAGRAVRQSKVVAAFRAQPCPWFRRIVA